MLYAPALAENFATEALERTPEPLGVLTHIIRKEIIAKDCAIDDDKKKKTVVLPAIASLIRGKLNLEGLLEVFAEHGILCITPVPDGLVRSIWFYTEWARRNQRQKEIEKERARQRIKNEPVEDLRTGAERLSEQTYDTCRQMGSYDANEVRAFVRPMLKWLLMQEIAWRIEFLPCGQYEMFREDIETIIGIMLEKFSVCMVARVQKPGEGLCETL